MKRVVLVALALVGCGGDVAPCDAPECELVARYTCGCSIERCDGALRVVVSNGREPTYEGVEFPALDDAVLACSFACGEVLR